MSKNFDFENQRRAANSSIRKMKKVSPFIYPEWQRVQQATTRLQEASRELALAQDAWDRLGQDESGESDGQ